jgi:parallel beta-helix repeat protein
MAGTFTMQDNASVRGNTAASSSGGGVYVYSAGTFTMKDSASVSGNTASSNGGGVYVTSNGMFTIQDNASVSDNTASSGGGIYVAEGTFIKKGGTIYGDTDTTHTADSDENTATSGNGHAVYLQSSSKKRNSTAGPTVNLYATYIGGAWTYNDTSAGGVGDTTANWE